jgi:mRNA-degrading endonuclease YafQ of YafQ-DinJ toxin-antitoxin module
MIFDFTVLYVKAIIIIKEYKLAIKRDCKPEVLQEIITLLVNEQPLPAKYLQNDERGTVKREKSTRSTV